MTDRLTEWWEAMPDNLKTPKILALAALMGGGASIGQSLLNDPRPDPFTGSMGRELEARQEAKHRMMEESWHEDLEAVNKRLERIEIRMDLRFDRLQDMIQEHDK